VYLPKEFKQVVYFSETTECVSEPNGLGSTLS